MDVADRAGVALEDRPPGQRQEVAVDADAQRHLRAPAAEPAEHAVQAEALLVGVVGGAEARGVGAVGVDLQQHARPAGGR